MRSSTCAVVAASVAFAFAACDQIGSPVDAGSDGPDARADVGFTFPEAGADVAPEVGSPPTHDAGPPDGSILSFPCIDAGADASSYQVCPAPKSYCDDQYLVDYAFPPFVACSDAGTCVFIPVTMDCIGSGCSGCYTNEAGSSCSCVIGE